MISPKTVQVLVKGSDVLLIGITAAQYKGSLRLTGESGTMYVCVWQFFTDAHNSHLLNVRKSTSNSAQTMCFLLQASPQQWSWTLLPQGGTNPSAYSLSHCVAILHYIFQMLVFPILFVNGLFYCVYCFFLPFLFYLKKIHSCK